MPDVWIHRPCSHRDDLPDRCIRCGARTTNRLTQTFTWVPPAAAALGGVVGWVVQEVCKKQCRVAVPLCERHQGHFWQGTLWSCGLLGAVVLVVAAVCALLVLVGQPDAALGSGMALGLFGLIGWLVVTLVMHYSSVRTTEITDDGIRLTGACSEFVRAYSGIQGNDRRVPRGTFDTWEDARDRRSAEAERRERREREDARRRMESDLYGRDDRRRRRDRRDDY